ncbi:hypothetical protein NP233_g6643 [Leucocoprinus birnbaumii]|uniref:Uncharacterized protein n=1 Tax=Leucocoprinus birnbaumii TaxID=56174 RepID=A0AAD5VSZ6_9AGAR|nr:hypothetical protein NP233_g6643 [Leucocoprinus birnbaumii]
MAANPAHRHIPPPTNFSDDKATAQAGNDSLDVELTPENNNDLNPANVLARALERVNLMWWPDKLSEKPKQDEYEQLLLENQRLRGDLEREKAAVQNANAGLSKSKGQNQGQAKALPEAILEQIEDIHTNGRKFTIMYEIFPPAGIFPTKLIPMEQCFDPLDGNKRYKNCENSQKAITGELLESIPQALHGLMISHRTPFVTAFNKAGGAARQQLVYRAIALAPKIWGEFREYSSLTVQQRITHPAFRKAIFCQLLLGLLPAASINSPILYPNCQQDLAKLLMTESIATLHKVFMHALASLDDDGPAKPKKGQHSKTKKTYATLWGVKGVTPGSIAFVATMEEIEKALRDQQAEDLTDQIEAAVAAAQVTSEEDPDNSLDDINAGVGGSNRWGGWDEGAPALILESWSDELRNTQQRVGTSNLPHLVNPAINSDNQAAPIVPETPPSLPVRATESEILNTQENQHEGPEDNEDDVATPALHDIPAPQATKKGRGKANKGGQGSRGGRGGKGS